MADRVNFWDLVSSGEFNANQAGDGSLDAYVAGEEGADTLLNSLGHERVASLQDVSVRALTDWGRDRHAQGLDVTAGTRVAFLYNTGSILTYEDIPDRGIEGTVVTVRSAAGDTTSHNGLVFVSWDDGRFRGVHAQHLEQVPARTSNRTATPVQVRRTVTAFGDLSDFLKVGGRDSDLVHRATRDLWSVQRDGDGVSIVRLFKDNGQPLKV